MLRSRLSYWPVLFLALWACRKDVEEFQPYSPTAQELITVMAEQVPGTTSVSTFMLSNLATDKVLETPNGTRIFLIDTDHLFANAASGQPVLTSTCPDLKVEVTEVLDKSDILARGLYTVADSGTLFESGGMVRVMVSCNGVTLALLPDRTLKIQLPNSDPQSGLFVFNQNIAGSATQPWIKSNQEVFEAEWPKADGSTQHGYELLVNHLDWAACGQLLTDPTSLFCIELPSGFGGQNTLAYLVFVNQQVVAQLQFDLGKNKFCYPKAPIGFQVQMAAVSKLGEQYWLGRAQTEIGTSATFPLSTQQMTQEAVINFVKSL